MNEQTVAEAVAEWGGDLLSIPSERRYSYPLALKTKSLDDIMALVQRSRLVRSDPAFPFSALQDAWLLVFDIEVSMVVDRPDDDESAQVAHEKLQDQVRRLRESLLADATLGDRVPMTSPLCEADFSAPYLQYEDQTRGQVALFLLSVAEIVDEPI